jgi:drug/metabolite transporter (DMT)-like permease
MSGIWYYAAGESFNFNISWAAPSVLSLLMLGIFGSGVAYITWYDALKEIPVSQLSVFIYIEPIITMALAVVMLNETINTATILGGIFTVVGIIFVNRK